MLLSCYFSADAAQGHSYHPELRQQFTYVPQWKVPSGYRSMAGCSHGMLESTKFSSVSVDIVCPHGVSYGGSLLRRKESVGAIYSLFRERLADVEGMI